MHIKTSTITEILDKVSYETNFSGVVIAKKDTEVYIQSAYGFSNRVEARSNTINTKFGIASGCKLFTSIGICQLVEKGYFTFETRLKDILTIDFPDFDDTITIHQLLTHTSGIPDYFDESIMDDYEDLWKNQPMYQIKSPRDFLPMFQQNKMMFHPSERFHYNNAGFILLGLIIEEKTGLSFTDYIDEHIFKACGMEDSGYFSLDQLPRDTAIGYIDDEENGTWRTNTFSVPIKGGPDGGAFVTAQNMISLWDGLINHKLLTEKMTEKLLTPHVEVNGDEFYGYGIWITKKEEKVFKYHVMGYDPGVSFASSYYPATNITLVIPSNKAVGPHTLTKVFEENM